MNFLKSKSTVLIAESCPICLETKQLCNVFHNDKTIHRFCYECISDWICVKGESVCPLCRKNITNIDMPLLNKTLNRFYTTLIKMGVSLRYFKNSDKNIVLYAVSRNGLALKYARDLFKNDFHIVFTAVSQNGLALQYASESMKNNTTIVHSAVKQCGLALRYAPHFNTNVHIALDAVKSHRFGYIYIDNGFFVPHINPLIQQGIKFAIDNKSPDFMIY